MKQPVCRALVLTLVSVAAVSCTSIGNPFASEVDSAQRPIPNRTEHSDAVQRFGHLLRCYPVALSRTFGIEVLRIPNASGIEGLPEDFRDVLSTVLSTIGTPIVPHDNDAYSLTLENLHQANGSRLPLPQQRPDLSLRGAITEGETQMRRGWTARMDALFSIKSRDDRRRRYRDDLDVGFEADRGFEVTTLAIDLRLVDAHLQLTPDRLAVSYRVSIVREERSSSFGVFFQGSGLGFRSYGFVAPSKSAALRAASEIAVIHLLGRFFQVPWWRVVEGASADIHVVRSYRQTLERVGSEEVSEHAKLLLLAHGFEVDRFETSKLGVSQGTDDLDLIVQLWTTVPIDQEDELATPRMDRLRWERRQQESLGAQSELAATPAYVTYEELIGLLSRVPSQPVMLAVTFPFERVGLDDAAKRQLDILARVLRHPSFNDLPITLAGHADERGSQRDNLVISEQRVRYVRDYLQVKHRIPASRISGKGYGAAHPRIPDAQSEAEHAANRRVEIFIGGSG